MKFMLQRRGTYPHNTLPSPLGNSMPSAVSAYRFGPYELRPRARELYKEGIKVKLRPQPFRVLELLVQQRGDVVTREALRQRLWESETFVDFEQGLNTAVKELRASLSDSAELPRYVETVPRVGYRIVVPVETVPLAESSHGSPELNAKPLEGTAAEVPAGPAVGHSRFSWLWPAIAAIVAVLVFSASVDWWWSHKRANAQQARGRVMLAVLPFENLTGDASQEYFSDGLTEEMISQLGRIDPEQLGVIARTSVMNYKQNPKPLDQIGRALGVEYVLEGSVRRDTNTVRVSAQLIQVKDQTHLWSRQYDRELSNLLTLQAEIAQETADEIELTLGAKPAPKSASHRPAVSPVSYEVYDLCLKGRYFWNQRTESGLHQAAEYFQQAIDKDANYAPAYAGLADALALLGTWRYVPAKDFMPKARATALKALQLDASLAEAHASLALIAEQYDYDWQTAEREFRRAIQLDPGDATAHQWYAECLSFEGRFDEALAESARARQLDPLSLIIATDDGVILYYSRQYDRAIEEFRTVREMQPDFPRSDIIMSAYVAKGDFADALSELEAVGRRGHAGSKAEMLAGETYLYGRWGRPAEAERWFAKYEAESKLHPSEADLPWAKLNAYMGVGRKDDAMAVLEKCYYDHAMVIALKVDSFYDPLRGDPRFQDLLRRTNLAQ
jgi:TolB-like protein/DNA-binding winged helix-turn-helix (wHTH) protein/Tfp pilus assembly protein PilF